MKLEFIFGAGPGSLGTRASIEGRRSLMVLGRGGSGKTALALTIAGLGHHERGRAWIDGIDVADIPARTKARAIGFVPTNVSALFSGLRSTVEGELDLSLDLLEINGPEREVSKAQVVAALDLGGLLRRDPFSLSGGERVRASVALVLVKRPTLLVLDQIYDALSENARWHLRGVLKQFTMGGGTVVEMHAYAPVWCADSDECIVLDSSRPAIGTYEGLLPDLDPYLMDDARWDQRARPRKAHRPGLADGARLIASDMTFSYGAGRFGLGPVNLDTQCGQAIAILGLNGAGKTTLLMTLGALLLPHGGSIAVASGGETVVAPQNSRDAYRWAANVLYAFQESDDQIYCKNVSQELRETARWLGGADPAWMEAVVKSLGLESVLDASPMSLPRPVRRLVSIGSVLTANPPVALLDEPTARLDRAQRDRVKEAVGMYLDQGRTCLFVSHDSGFVSEVATRTLYVADGRILQDQPW